MHQFCTLVGYGADAICPYLAYEALFALHETGKLPASMSREDIVQKYIKWVGFVSGVWGFVGWQGQGLGICGSVCVGLCPHSAAWTEGGVRWRVGIVC